MRLFVTGIGLVSPLGLATEPTWRRLLAGERAIGPLSLFAMPGARASIAAEVRGIVPPPEWSRADAFALAAVREALGDLEGDVGLVLGGSQAGLYETELALAMAGDAPERTEPFPGARTQPLSATMDRLRETFPGLGPARTVCSACSSGATAILLACAWLLAGRAERVVAGATEGLCRVVYSGFNALAAVDPAPCRPFDLRRAGLNVGEGAAFLLIETEASARSRGARVVCELRGGAIGAEAHHITNPEQDGRTAARVMRAALARAIVRGADIDYVHAHGTATPRNDSMEAAAIRACLGAEVDRVPVSSSKGQIGHTLGAAGAFGAAFAALAVERSALPPTAGLVEPDPACALVHVREARVGRVRAAMTNAFGFGGTDVTLVMAEPELFPPLGREGRRVVVTGAGTLGPRGVGDGGAYLGDGDGPPPEGPIAFTPAEHLDVARMRRLDRLARMSTISALHALAAAGIAEDERTGVVLGSAYGAVDASVAYVRRLVDRGARFVSAADFPNLLPSSPSAHLSIYAGLGAAAVSVAELAQSGEAALATAADLIAASHADRIVAGAVEESSRLVDRILAPASEGTPLDRRHGEGAATLVMEAEQAARLRGACVLAHVSSWTAWRPADGCAASLPALTDRRRAIVTPRVTPALRAWLAGSAWADVPTRTVDARAGTHAATGAFAFAAAVSLLASGRADAVLVASAATGVGYAFILEAGDPGGRSTAPA